MSVDIERENSVSITDRILRCRCLKLSRYSVNREFQERVLRKHSLSNIFERLIE